MNKNQDTNSNISYGWLTSVLISAIGGLIVILLTYWQSNQAATNSHQAYINSQTQTSISSLNTEAVKQTALLIVIAEKDGISDEEVNELLGLPAASEQASSK